MAFYNFTEPDNTKAFQALLDELSNFHYPDLKYKISFYQESGPQHRGVVVFILIAHYDFIKHMDDMNKLFMDPNEKELRDLYFENKEKAIALVIKRNSTMYEEWMVDADEWFSSSLVRESTVKNSVMRFLNNVAFKAHQYILANLASKPPEE